MKLQLSATILKPLRDLTRRKSRSLLTILGIAVGVASLVAIVSTSRNLARAQAAAYADTTQADLTYWAWDVPAGLERILAALPNVAVVELRCTYYTRAQLGNTWYDLYFIGIDEFAAMRVNKIALREGRYPGPGEVLLEVSAKDLQPLAVGEQIIYRAGVDHAERPLTISGFAQSPAQPSAVFLNLVYAYAPASQVRRMLDIAGSNQVVVKLEDFGARNETIAEIRKVFAKRQIQYDEPRVRDPDYFEGKRELDALVRVMYAFSGLGLVISAFLVANTLAAVVAEQTREIGIMKSIGGARAHILRIYLLEAGLYGLFGAALGLALGTVVSWLLLRYAGWALNLAIEPRPSWPGLLLGGAMGLLAALLGGLGPARQAAGLSVREALGSHGITATYRLGWLDRLWEMWRSAPALVVMAARNLARRAGRHAVTLLFTAAATAALLAALSTGQSVNRSIAQIFGTYRADAWIWLGEVVSVHFAAELEAMPEVLRAEPWTLADAWVRLGKVRLWGLPAETQLYHPKLAAGRWYAPGEWDAAVISAELAEGRDIRLGETIEVDTGEAVRPFRVVGIAVDNAIFLGGAVAGKVFVPRETVERMVQRQGRSYFYALSLAAGDLRAADAALNRIERQFRDLRPVTESARRDMQSAQQQSRLLSISLYVMTVLIALAGGLGVMNTLTLNVLERRREIGVMRAIGATNSWYAMLLTLGGFVVNSTGHMSISHILEPTWYNQ